MNALAQFAVEFFSDFSRIDRDLKRAEKKGEEGGRRMASAFHDEMRRTLSGGANASALGGVIGNSLQGAAGIGLMVASFRGLKAASDSAANLGFYRRQLTGIAGDATKAAAAMKELSDAATATNFDTDQVFSLGVGMSNKFGDVKKGSQVTTNLLDAAAASGVENRNFNDFQSVLTGIASRGNEMIPLESLEALKRAAPTLNSNVQKTLGLSASQTEMRLRGMTGNQLLTTLQNVGINNKGAAAAQAGADPQSIAANILDDIKVGLAPTGDLVNTALIPLANGLKAVTGAARAANDATGGTAGLVVGVGLLAGGIALTVGPAIAAYRAVLTLSGAITALAASATQATAAVGAQSVVNQTGGVGAAPGFGMNPAMATQLGLQALGVGATLAGGALAGSKDKDKQVAGRYLSYSGIGLQIGSAIGGAIGGIGGAFVGGVGAVPGAVIGSSVGGALGAGVGGMMAYKAGADEKNDGTKKALDANTAAIQDNTMAVKMVDSKTFGGGARTAYGTSQAEREYVTFHLMNATKLGVG